MNTLASEIAQAFGASEVELALIRDAQGGATVYRAELDGKRFSLRMSGPMLSSQPDWIEFEGQILEQAKTLGVSVAAAIRGANGRFGQPVGQAVALLTDWAEGDIEWPTPAPKAFALGQVVAQLHVATSGSLEPKSTRRFDAEWLIDRPLALISEVADPSPLLRHLDPLRRRLNAISSTQAAFGPIHGDVHQGNAHFEGPTATLFDFAQCGVGWRVFDLAGFLWPWRDDSINKLELRAGCNAYLKGYASIRPLEPEELSALPAVVQLRDLWETGEWVAAGNGREKPDQVQLAIEALRDRWTAHPLRDALE